MLLRAIPAVLVGALLLGGCGVAVGGAGVAGDEVLEGAVLLERLERRLLEGPLELRYRVTSEGAFEAELEGEMRIEGSTVELAGDGSFGGAPVRLRLAADADSLRLESPRGEHAAAAPPQLREALVIGLTRMGILHNLARLTAGAAPDRGEGGVREWVELHEVRPDTAPSPDPRWLGLRFDIHVAGTRTAEAVLWLDRTTGLPTRREQVVRFPTGEMRVREDYGVTIYN